MAAAVAATADEFSMDQCVRRLSKVYREVQRNSNRVTPNPTVWSKLGNRIVEECNVWVRVGRACYDAVAGGTPGASRQEAA
jgi:hypothetical protein